ncbi:MAG TPA: alcohol dehydrogenase catalytic domain-containing protein [Dehalococcoidales bacterium]|nr:alcohol dehydrogenase catalytic domain-containing protein [Dehalococcoidales bacterium]
MKALVKTSKAPGFEYVDVDVPTIGPKDVLIKVKGTTICGSDIHAFHSAPTTLDLMKIPVILGHETCGEVVEVGECVTNIKKGDLVSVEPHIFCGVCYYCQTGAALNCKNLAIFGIQTDGAFAEYAKAPEICCWKHPKGTPYELGAIHEPLGVAVHGVLAGEINSKSVAVFGCGPIGLFAIGASKVFGATKVFGLEVAPKRLALARQLFPDAILINSKEQDPVKTIMEATDGLGVDVAIELSGNAEAMKQAFKALKREGRISLVGMTPGPVELEVHKDIILKEAKVLGVFGRVIWQTWWQVRAMLDTGKFDPLPVITHRFPLADFAKAFELAESGEAGKILLYP